MVSAPDLTTHWPTRGLGPLQAVPEALESFVDAGIFGAADIHVANTLARAGGDHRDEVLLAAALAVRAPRRRHVCVDLATVHTHILAEVDTTALDPLATSRGDANPIGADQLEMSAQIAHTEALIAELPWPSLQPWLETLRNSPLVAVRDPAEPHETADVGVDVAPLTLAGSRLYLDRYWRYERRVAADLSERATKPADVNIEVAAAAIDEMFDADPVDRQRVAAALAACRHLTVIAGGPGTGKTTTVARLLRTIAATTRTASTSAANGLARPADELTSGPDAAGAGDAGTGDARTHGAGTGDALTGRVGELEGLPHVALAAPTGKAAARLTESLRHAVEQLPPDNPDRMWLGSLAASTVHRLLGGGRSTRFRFNRTRPLPHDVIIIDEASMMPLALLAKLLDAVGPEARLVLVGDPHQLASVEAGSVLADIVGDPSATPVRHPEVRAELAAIAGSEHLDDVAEHPNTGVHDALVVLNRVHRFKQDSGVDRLAKAVRDGHADAAINILENADDLTWIQAKSPESAGVGAATGLGKQQQPGVVTYEGRGLDALREAIICAYRPVLTAAREGNAEAALAGLDQLRVLCAHRRGRDGVAGWVPRIEAWAAEDLNLDVRSNWYVGRPVLVTANDARLELFNGDLGVVVRAGDAVAVAFAGTDDDQPRLISPARVGAVETVHAMTVHKSQGSQVDHAVVALPEPASRICTRELLYTAVTRAKEHVTVIASKEALRATIEAQTQRASGLAEVLGR